MTPKSRPAPKRTAAQAKRDRKLLDAQREANSHLVVVAIHAQEKRDDAVEALARAVETERQLRDTAELRETFVGVLGHDLRGPLGTIMMAGELLLERGQLDENDTLMVERFLRSTRRITRMVRRLLDLTATRLGGGLPLTMAHGDMRTLCAEVAEQFKGDRIDVSCSADSMGKWDCDRILDVLTNLVSNAFDHASVGSRVRVVVSSYETELVIAVINEGEPIPEEFLPVLFEPFRRAKQYERSRDGNLGLGLYISHEIVAAHGGTLEALSKDGVTTFTIHLPRTPVAT